MRKVKWTIHAEQNNPQYTHENVISIEQRKMGHWFSLRQLVHAMNRDFSAVKFETFTIEFFNIFAQNIDRVLDQKYEK